METLTILYDLRADNDMFNKKMRPLLLTLLSLLQTIHTQNIFLHNEGIQNSESPFLSTTLSAKVTYNSESSSTSFLQFDSTRKSIFSDTLADFLAHIFTDQEVYDLKIIGVNVFDDHILHNGRYDEGTYVGHLVDFDGETDGVDELPTVLSFSMVISAEYTSEGQMDSISSDTFRKMLMHVCDKFQSHLLKYMREKSGDAYFTGVDSIVLVDFERVDTNPGQAGGPTTIENMMSAYNIYVGSIVAIVVGGIIFIVLSVATVKYYRKVKELKAARWRSKEMGSLNSATLSSKNSSVAVVDDYSFDPLDGANKYNTTTNSYGDYTDEPNNVWPGLAPHRTIFPAPGAVAAPIDELKWLPRQHVFAPPGKIGVAIDVLDGQPVVHRVRRGSPLEKILQPNDVIIAIDDEDIGCMSAADVTSKLVRRMDRVRKITFVRRMEL